MKSVCVCVCARARIKKTGEILRVLEVNANVFLSPKIALLGPLKVVRFSDSLSRRQKS